MGLPLRSNYLRNKFFNLFIGTLFTLQGCYQDTRTCKCARQPRFNLKDDCHPAEQFIDQWATGIQLGIAITFHPDTERFSPEFNPSDENEIAFILKQRTPDDTTDARIKPQMVIANLSSGEHYFVHELPWLSRDNSISWGRNDHIILNGSNSKSYFFDTKTRTLIDSIQHGLLESTWSYNSNYIVGWTQNNDTRNWGLGVLNWPQLEKLQTKFESLPLSTTSSIAWSQENEIALRQMDEVGAINFETEHYSTIFRSEADIEIGLQGDVGSKTDYAWAPNNNDLYFVNNTGIFKVRKGDNKQYRIKKNCPNRQYEQISVSPNGDKIIAQRRDIKTERDGKYISENIKLVIMDMNGCNEEILFEDWDGLVSGKP